MMQTARGRTHIWPFPVREGGAVDVAAMAEHRGVGFRLAHDDAGRVIRDGSWRNTAVYWRTAPFVTVDPDYYTSYLGFRLVREDT
ncbi:hypothetical protein EBZ80_08640 [bacterium]|nr:hypothetical protein [bacterium]